MRPSGNSSASWCLRGSFLFTCRKIAVADLVFPPSNRDEAEICNCHRAGKRKLGSRKNANRHSSIFRRSEPACARYQSLVW